MKNWATQSMTTGTRIRITAGTATQKTMHTTYGDMEMAVPRDRNGDYEPQLIKKYQNTVTQDMEERLLSMYEKAWPPGT